MGQDRVKNGEKDLQEKLQEINRNLDRVKLRIRSGKFYIRGMFSPRPGETENVRTDLATGCSATPAGLRVAKMKAEDINLQLLNDRFDWTPFLKGRLKHLKPASTIGEWLPLYEEHHWQKNDRSNVITTWVISSGNIFATVSFHLPRWTFVMPMPDECIARGLKGEIGARRTR